MEDITNGWNSLSDREGDDMLPRKKNPSQEFSLLAKFLTKRALNVDVVAKTLKPLWRSHNGFKIQNLGDHQLFSFLIMKQK